MRIVCTSTCIHVHTFVLKLEHHTHMVMLTHTMTMSVYTTVRNDAILDHIHTPIQQVHSTKGFTTE